MAGAGLFTKALHHHCITRLQWTTRISYERRQFVLPRCAAASQATVRLLTAAQERAALRAAESSREGESVLLFVEFFRPGSFPQLQSSGSVGIWVQTRRC